MPDDARITVAKKHGITVRKIKIYPTLPLKPLCLQGLSPFTTAHFMVFPLFLPLRAETREFYCKTIWNIFFRNE